MTPHFAFVVIGAGPAGMLAALSLGRAQHSVALVERQLLNDDDIKIGETVPAAFNALLERLSLPPLDPSVHRPIPGHESLWAGVYQRQDAIRYAQGLGWRLNRTAFELQLRHLVQEQNVDCWNESITGLARIGGKWRLDCQSRQSLSADFLVDASGRAGVVSRKLGVERQKGPPLVAMWAKGKTMWAKDKTMWAKGKTICAEGNSITGIQATAQTLTESQEQGWWYGAYLPNGHPIVIFHTDAQVAAFYQKSPELWLQQLRDTELISRHIDWKAFQNVPIFRQEARSVRLKHVYGENWAACGDAALSFDPISSQGIFNACANAHRLSEVLRTTERANALQHYQQQLFNVEHIYQRRRREYYQAAAAFHQSNFWQMQLTEKDVMLSVEILPAE